MKHTGECLCGQVTFEVDAILEKAESCHCTQCRKWTGHYLSGVTVPQNSLSILSDETLAWFNSSAHARRGFCSNCGSSLFFEPTDKDKHDWIGILGGALNEPTGAKMALHIFTAEKGDYYDITDGAQQNEY